MTWAVAQSAVELVVGLLRLGAELTPVILCLVALRVAASRPSARSMELPPRTHPTDQYGDDLLATKGVLHGEMTFTSDEGAFNRWR